jgi:hypothetical protein
MSWPWVSYLSHERNPVFASVLVNAESRHSSCPIQDEPCADSSAGETILDMILTRPVNTNMPKSHTSYRSRECGVWKYSNMLSLEVSQALASWSLLDSRLCGADDYIGIRELL